MQKVSWKKAAPALVEINMFKKVGKRDKKKPNQWIN